MKDKKNPFDKFERDEDGIIRFRSPDEEKEFDRLCQEEGIEPTTLESIFRNPTTTRGMLKFVITNPDFFKHPNRAKYIKRKFRTGHLNRKEQLRIWEHLLQWFLFVYEFYGRTIHETNSDFDEVAEQEIQHLGGSSKATTESSEPLSATDEFLQNLESEFPKLVAHLRGRRRSEDGLIIWDDKMQNLGWIIEQVDRTRTRKFTYYAKFFANKSGQPVTERSLESGATRTRGDGGASVPSHIRQLIQG